MVAFPQSVGEFASWTFQEEVHLPLPLPTGVTGEVRYDWEGLPRGLFLNEATLVIYGAPLELEASGRFRLRATDSRNTVAYLFDFEVAPPSPVLDIAPFADLRFVIGQEFDYQLPEPRNGSGDYTYEIVAPTRPANSPVDVELRLPDGIDFAPTGRFTGTPSDAEENRGATWFDQVVNVIRAGDASNRIRRVSQFANLDAASNRFTIRGVEHTGLISITRTGRIVVADSPGAGGNLRFRFTPYFTADSLPRNNPYIRIQNEDIRTVSTYYLASAQIFPAGQWNLQWAVPGVESDRFLAPPDPFAILPLVNVGQSVGLFRWTIGASPAYTLRLRVTDNSNGVSYEQDVNVQVTAPTGPSTRPLVTGLRSTSRHLQLEVSNTPPGAGVEYSLVAAGEQAGGYTAFPGPRLRFNELSPAEDYYLWLRFTDADGPGAASLFRVATFRRAGGLPPPAPQNLTIHNNPGDFAGALDGKLRVRWKEADVTNQVIDYLVQDVPAGQPFQPDGWRKVPYSTGATSTALIPGLRNGEPRRVGVRARNTPGGDGDIAEVTAIPEAGRPDLRYDRVQLQVLMDLDGRGAPWFDVAHRIITGKGGNALTITSGRQPKQDLVNAGVCQFTLETSDDFITYERGSEEESRALYNLDDLRGCQISVSSLVEEPGGNLRGVTHFTGIVTQADFAYRNQRATVRVIASDSLEILRRTQVRIEEAIPSELSGNRVLRILEAAGWTPRADAVAFGLTSYDPGLIDAGTKVLAGIDAGDGRSRTVTLNVETRTGFEQLTGTTGEVRQITVTNPPPYQGNALDILNLIAQSEGGRFYWVKGGYGLAGNLRFEAASPITVTDGEITDRGVGIRAAGQPIIESDSSSVYNTFRLSYPGGAEPITNDDVDDPEQALQASISEFGIRNWRYQQVLTNRESTLALVRQLIKLYAAPRFWVREVPLAGHFQRGARILQVQDIDLTKSYVFDYTPPQSASVITVQRVDRVVWAFRQLDKQFAQMNVNLSLLLPEASAYWILNREGADRLDLETVLAPVRSDDPAARSLGGRFDWRTSPDQEYQVVSANRFGAYLVEQNMPQYRSAEDRDALEGANPPDGRACVVMDLESPVRRIELHEYSAGDLQWLIRAHASEADANPVSRAYLMGDETAGLLGRAHGNLLGGTGLPVFAHL